MSPCGWVPYGKFRLYWVQPHRPPNPGRLPKAAVWPRSICLCGSLTKKCRNGSGLIWSARNKAAVCRVNFRRLCWRRCGTKSRRGAKSCCSKTEGGMLLPCIAKTVHGRPDATNAIWPWSITKANTVCVAMVVVRFLPRHPVAVLAVVRGLFTKVMEPKRSRSRWRCCYQKSAWLAWTRTPSDPKTYTAGPWMPFSGAIFRFWLVRK